MKFEDHNMLSENQRVVDIATELPGATAVFFKHKINFCASNQETLGAVLNSPVTDADAIKGELSELIKSQDEASDFEGWSNPEIITHIITRFHNVHREQLPELVRLASRVEARHSTHQYCPNGLAQQLAKMKDSLEEHMKKEELILFPMLANEQTKMASAPIRVMMHEHDQHMSDINTLFELTNDIQLPQNACNSWTALYVGLQAFVNDIYMHIYIENNILFVR